MMRSTVLYLRALYAFFIFGFLFLANGEAATRCDGSPRIIGAFGAMDEPKPSISVAPEIRALMPEAVAIRHIEQSRLSLSGEQIILYDASRTPEPNPKVAVIANGVIAKTYDLATLVEYGQGAIYATSCEFQFTPTQRGLAVAYTLSGDGTGSAFLVITWSASAGYQLLFHQTVGQGRIVLGRGKLELWERTFSKDRHPEDSNFECEWCDHRYLITLFEWRNGTYVKVRAKRTPKTYDPAEVTGVPIEIETK
jgi:hypothetical protein